MRTKKPDPLGYYIHKKSRRGIAATRLLRAKRRAKAKGIDFDLKAEDLKVPSRCPVLGIPLTFSSDKFSETLPHIDRLDNSKGYTKDNIRIISGRANRLKGRIKKEDVDDMLKILKWMKRQMKTQQST